MHQAAETPKKKAKKTAKANDPVKCRELPKTHSQRKAGYRWMVESRLGGKRSRKFFRHDEAKERDEHIADMEVRADKLAKKDRGIVSNESLLTDAADRIHSPQALREVHCRCRGVSLPAPRSRGQTAMPRPFP